MSIQPGIISAGSTITRADTKAVAGAIVPAIPPESYLIPAVNSGFLPTEVLQPADIEGRIVFYRDGTSTMLQAYVVVKIGLDLQWKQVIIARTINSLTGRPYDPLAGFYDPLAS